MDEYIKKLEDTNKLLEEKLFLYSYKFGEIDTEEIKNEIAKEQDLKKRIQEELKWTIGSTTILTQPTNLTNPLLVNGHGITNSSYVFNDIGDVVGIKDHNTISFDSNLPFVKSTDLEALQVSIQNTIYKTRPKQSNFIRRPRVFLKKLKRKIYEKTRIS